MADISLTVGVDATGSYGEFKSGIQTLVDRVNSRPPKIKVEIDESSLGDIRKQVDDVLKEVNKSTSRNKKSTSRNSTKKGGLKNTSSDDLKEEKKLYDLITRANKEELSLSKELANYTAAKNGKSSKSYASFKKDIDSFKSLNSELRSGKIQIDEYELAYKKLHSSMSKHILDMGKNNELQKSIEDQTKDLQSKKYDKLAYKRTENITKAYNAVGTAFSNLDKWSAAKNGKTSAYYSRYEKDTHALENLARQLRYGQISVEEFDTGFKKIKSTMAISEAAMRKAGEATRDLTQKLTENDKKRIDALEGTRDKKIIKANKEELALQKEIEAFTAAKTGKSKDAYAGFESDVREFQTLNEQLRNGSIQISDYNDRYNKLMASMSKHKLDIGKNNELKKNIDAKELALKEIERKNKLISQGYNLSKQGEANLSKWTSAKNGNSKAAYEQYKNSVKEITNLTKKLDLGKILPDDFENKFKAIKKTMLEASVKIQKAGENTKGLKDRLGGLAQKFASWFTVSQALMFAVSSVKKMVSASIELDTAMTELKKVTNETDDTYENFLNNAESRSKKIGASLVDTVNATADFARLGYGIKDAERLADAAAVYKNVGDGIENIGEASSSIIATMQAFGIEASDAMSIVDKFNEVGNNYAISSDGVGQALIRSAAAMKAANNTLDETIALATAANTIVQDPEKVGTTLKTVSMYLRASKTDAEAAGESTDGMAESVSKLRDEILKLTGGKVDIQLDENTFKSTYQILKELSGVWKELSDISQANLLERLGGKRNSNVVSALLENFSIAEKALETSANAEGSAMAENEKQLNSIQGRLNIMKASFQSLSGDIMNSDLVKFFVDAATAMLNMADGAVNLVDKLGGLKTILVAIVGTAVSLNATSILELFKSIGKLPKMFSGFSTEIGASLLYFVDGFKSASKESAGFFKSVSSGLSSMASASGGALSGFSIGLMGITTAVTIATAAYGAWRNEIKASRNEIIDTAKASSDEAMNVLKLYATYDKAQSAYNNATGSKEELENATNNLLSSFEHEKMSVESLGDSYNDLGDKIRSVSMKELSKQFDEAASDAKSALKATKDNVEDYLGLGGDIGSNASRLFNVGHAKRTLYWQEDDDNIRKKITGILKGLDFKNLSVQNSDKSMAGLIDIDNGSVENAIKSYNELLLLQEELKSSMTSKEYESSDLASELENTISDYKENVAIYEDAVDELNKKSALKELTKSLSDNGIPKTSSDLERLKKDLLDAASASDEFFEIGDADISSAFDYAFNELKQNMPELADVIDRSAKIAKNSSDIYKDAVNAITETTSNAAESTNKIISGMTAVQESINAQKAGKSITNDLYGSDDISEYRDALEYVNGTMQLNAERVREIAEAKAEEQIATNDANKALEQTKYLENANQIEKYRQKLKDRNFEEGETASSIQSSIDLLLEENSAIAYACDQYDLLSQSLREATSSYQHWLNAQSASDYGDMANDAESAIGLIRDTYNPESDIFGNFGSKKFSAAVDFIVPDSVDDEDLGAIEQYMSDFSQYLTFGEDGKLNGLNIDQFLNKSLEAGLMKMDGDEFVIAGQKTMEDFAKGLNMSSGMVQAFFDELQLKGADFDWADESNRTLGDLAISANEAAERLRSSESEFSHYAFKIDVSDVENADQKILYLDESIRAMKDIKSKVSVDSSEAKDANEIIRYCVVQKQMLEQPAVMSVDTSLVQGKMQEVVGLFQEFHKAQEELELAQALDIDTSSAQQKLDEVTAKIQGLDPALQKSLQIDTSSADTISQYISQQFTQPKMIDYGVNKDAIIGFQQENHDADGKVKWDNETSKVDAYSATKKYASGKVKWWNDTQNVKTSFTASGTINWGGSPSQPNGKGKNKNGKQSLNGTAHVSGTARMFGDWGTAAGGKTLVGELGREIVVDPHTGKWYTVGDNGAEFVNVPAGAIVFNHVQSDNLLKNGYVSGRASALVNGTAMVTGGYKPYRPSGSLSVSSSSKPSNNNTTHNSNPAKSASSAAKATNDALDAITDYFDWIKLRYDRLARETELSEKSIDTAIGLIDKQSKTADTIKKVQAEINAAQQGANRYLSHANWFASSSGLSGDIVNRIQNGTIDINKYDEDTKKKIDEYKSWYDEYLNSLDKVTELQKKELELAQRRLSNIEDFYKLVIDVSESLQDANDALLKFEEAKGFSNVSDSVRKVYEQSMQEAQTVYDNSVEQLSAYQAEFNELVAKGYIKEGSDAWHEAQAKMNELTEAVHNAGTSIVDFEDKIRDIEYTKIQNIIDGFDRVVSKLDAYISLMESRDQAVPESLYQKQIDSNNSKIQANHDLRNAKLKEQAFYDVNSKRYQELAEEINKIDTETLGLMADNEKLKDSIFKLRFTPLDEAIEKYGKLSGEIDKFMGLLNDKAFFDKNGNGTIELATHIAMIQQQMGLAKQKIADYRTGLDKLQQSLDNGVISQKEFNEKSEEYRDGLQNSVIDIKKYQDSLTDLYMTQLKNEVDATEKVIDKWAEARNQQEKYWDYSKRLKGQQKSVDMLKAQIQALNGVNNASAMAEKKRLEAELAKEQESLDDIKRDHRNEMMDLGDQKNKEALQTMLEETEYNIAHSAEKQETVISQMLDRVLGKYQDVFGKINSIIGNTGWIGSNGFNTTQGQLGSISGAQSQNNAATQKPSNTKPSGTASGTVTDGIKDNASINGQIESEIMKDPNTTNRKVAEVKLSKSSVSIQEGQAVTITAAIRPTDAKNKTLSWSTSNSSIATVSDGVIRGLKPGKCNVTANTTDGSGLSATVSVTVTKKPDPPKPPKPPVNNNGGGDGIARVGDRVTLKSGQSYYYDSWGVSPAGNRYSGVKNGVVIDGYSAAKYGGSARYTGGYDVHIKSADGRFGDLGWVRLDQLEGYARGTGYRGVLKNQYAWTQEHGQEMIYRKVDGALLTKLGKGDVVFNNKMTKNLMDWGKINPVEIMSNNIHHTLPNRGSGITVEQNIGNLLTVQGNVDKEALPELKELLRQSCDYTVKHINTELKKNGFRR